jgi:hypothetical protein
MNESEKAAPSTTAEAAKAVLARRSNQQIPLSLGKASLRMRLEAYYSLIAPDTLTDRTEWLNRYDQIYEKVSRPWAAVLLLLLAPQDFIGGLSQ